jgi:hypothetical protein
VAFPIDWSVNQPGEYLIERPDWTDQRSGGVCGAAAERTDRRRRTTSARDKGGVYPPSMGLVLAISVGAKAAAVLLFAFVVAPAIGFGLKRLTGGWDSYGGGAFSILQEPRGREEGGSASVDPAVQAAEVRQMLAAKAARQEERGEDVLDVEAESARLLAAEAEAAPAAHDGELRAEVRQLVVARNERRARQGLAPLDVEAETERQLADLGGAG